MNQTIEKHFLALLETDSSRTIADIIVNEIGNNPEYFRIVFDYCLTKPYPVSMRAARALQLCCEDRKSLINPYLNNIVCYALSSKIEGVRRGFLKIISELPDILNLNESGILINQCFEWIVSQNENPAIRVYSMEIVYNVCKLEPLLKNELTSVMELVKDDKSMAVRSRAKRILDAI